MEKSKDQEMKREVWDCGSSVYDSFELKSLQHQLNSAISGRTMSMPHLSHRRQPPPADNNKPTSNKHSKISRSLNKFLRSLFRTKQNHHASSINGGNFYVYDTTGALSTIPEVPETLPEFGGLSPEMKSLVKMTRSTSLGISCV